MRASRERPFPTLAISDDARIIGPTGRPRRLADERSTVAVPFGKLQPAERRSRNRSDDACGAAKSTCQSGIRMAHSGFSGLPTSALSANARGVPAGLFRNCKGIPRCIRRIGRLSFSTPGQVRPAVSEGTNDECGPDADGRIYDSRGLAFMRASADCFATATSDRRVVPRFRIRL